MGRDEARSLLTAGAVRERAHALLERGLDDGLDHFSVRLEALEPVADFVIETMRDAYPDLDVPFHSRWRHLASGGIDRWGMLAGARGWPTSAEAARAAVDLAVVSVLLDAGAGSDWRYREGATGLTFARSEGLAVASIAMWANGHFSSDPTDPLRVDAEALIAFSPQALEEGLQVSPTNPLVGLDGRAALLNRLGAVIAEREDLFAIADAPRPGGLYDALAARTVNGQLEAGIILEALLDGLAPIWPGRLTLDGFLLGDTWRHAKLVRDGPTDGLVPFHKLSQWMAYSLIEPLAAGGVAVGDIDGLTGLAEYRNGGLFIDLGVLVPRDPTLADESLDVGSEPVVEWRALTVALLDRLAAIIRKRLGADATTMPLAKILEGGTWAAGRRIAKTKRPDGGPPLAIVSDGTVF